MKIKKMLTLSVWLVPVLFIAGAALRIWGAWMMRYTIHADVGIVALMAKHISEARDFPVFFYGQSYMGSLEPFVTALIFKIFGISMFTVCLGTAVCGMFPMAAVYWWARDMRGKTAGIIALALCVLGPSFFYSFSFVPRGGYALTMFFSAFILWRAPALLHMEKYSGHSNIRDYILLGLAAGLGWWTNQLITPVLFSMFLLFLLFSPGLLVKPRIIFPVTAGFFTGSLPFWIWNLNNQWKTFDFLNSFHPRSMAEGLKSFYFSRLAQLFDLNNPDPAISLTGTVLYLVLLIIFTGLLIRWYRKGQYKRFYMAAGMILFVAVYSVIFSRSHFSSFNTPKYLVILVPGAMVAAACSIRHLFCLKIKSIALSVFSMLLLYQAVNFPLSGWNNENDPEFYAEAGNLAEFLSEHSITAVYNLYQHHSLNFMLNERFCFSDMRRDRYFPYTQHNEMQDNIAVINNLGGVAGFMANSGGSAKEQKFAGKWIQSLHYSFLPPGKETAPVSNSLISACRDSGGRDVRDQVFGRNLSHQWQSLRKPEEEEWIDVEFTEPVLLSRISMQCRDFSYPRKFSIFAKSDSGWECLKKDTALNYFFWNGPRMFWKGDTFRLEIEFFPVRTRGLRIKKEKAWQSSPWRISDMNLFCETGLKAKEERLSSAEVLSALDRLKIRRLYCDRWLSNLVSRSSGGMISVCREPSIFSEAPDYSGPEMHFTPDTAVLVRREYSDHLDQALAARNIGMLKTSIPPWVLYSFATDTWKSWYAEDPSLFWTGYSCLRDDRRHAKNLTRRAAQKEPPEAESLLVEALKCDPGNYQAAVMLAAIFRQSGRDDRQKTLLEDCITKTMPAVSCPVYFENNIEFLGVTFSSETVNPGDKLIIRFAWHVPSDYKKGSVSVFFHCMGQDSILFQDDFALLNETRQEEISEQTPGTVFHQTRVLIVPSGIPDGESLLSAGIVDPVTMRRFKGKSRHQLRDRAVILPVKLIIRGENDKK